MIPMEQLVVRVPDEMAKAVDDLVDAGEFETRSDAVRAAVHAMLDRRRRDEIGNQINQGYARVPDTEAEMWAAQETARISIEEEPW
jgi:Arc/MetJ-type ribon-helix-helix transcriptional regulator